MPMIVAALVFLTLVGGFGFLGRFVAGVAVGAGLLALLLICGAAHVM